MPLSKPAKRKALHKRTIVIDGYEREDGLWDIEGHLTDVKTYGFDSSWRGHVAPGTPVHEMRVRLTIDDDMRIVESEAVTENHPFPTCPHAAPNFSELAGIRIGPGWMREVRKRAGGKEGCTHILEMLAQIGTTAFQTMVAKRNRESENNPSSGEPQKRPPLLNSCYAFRADGPVVKELWPAFHEPPAEDDKSGGNRA